MSNSDFNNISFDLPKNQSNVIKVIGVGGGGSNAVNHMYSQGIVGVDFVICNTDAQALQNSPIPSKIQLGISLTEGLGAGANPEVGERAALENEQEIKEMLSHNSKMIFITVGMGGGTGTGAAPVIARIAREMDILTIGIVTIPFSFEGKMRNEQAQKGIDKMRQYVDSLVVINNNKLREVYGNLGFKAGFSKADEVLSTAARGIAEVITHHYTQNIDLKDAKTVLSNSGTAIMGSAIASGENRSEIAISKALDSPLLNDNKITGAKNVLLLIVSGTEEITIDEIGEINDFIQTEAKSNVNIIMGVGEDETLGDAISVTIVATGFTKDQQHEISNTEVKKIIHNLNTDQEAIFDLSDKKIIQSGEKKTIHPLGEETFSSSKIVHSLDEEEVESEFNLIATNEFIKNIDVVYDRISYDKIEDFVITSVKPEIIEIEEQIFDIKEEKQISFTFDLPFVKNTKKEGENDFNSNSGKTEVVDPQIIKSTKKIDDDVYFSLEDYADLEDSLVNATKKEVVKPVIEDEMRFSLRQEPDFDINNYEVVDHKEVTPLALTIAELQEKTVERREKMKIFNYKFGTNLKKNIDEIEKEPAYKRRGVELSDNFHSSNITASRTTLEIDENDEIQFRSNNSFLHDNVD
ncbi:cell division protein FtsZ [Lutibacter sp.]|uniref:cell division protein FtsZ n=1 Tax=Lutibacter sp. TaxID=1925666 RepID=UPI0027341F25|nr:cell division protein FtsZ [Lutibacter sp.]MDP3313362.1 cell division protein FtsZ [Lutibacter sp.]